MEKFIVLEGIEINLTGLTSGERIAVGTLCEEGRLDCLHKFISNDRIKKIGIEAIPARWCGIDDQISCPSLNISFVDDDENTLRYTKATLVEKLSDYLDSDIVDSLDRIPTKPSSVYLVDDQNESDEVLTINKESFAVRDEMAIEAIKELSATVKECLPKQTLKKQKHLTAKDYPIEGEHGKWYPQDDYLKLPAVREKHVDIDKLRSDREPRNGAIIAPSPSPEGFVWGKDGNGRLFSHTNKHRNKPCKYFVFDPPFQKMNVDDYNQLVGENLERFKEMERKAKIEIAQVRQLGVFFPCFPVSEPQSFHYIAIKNYFLTNCDGIFKPKYWSKIS
jgi:hypothetical protein